MRVPAPALFAATIALTGIACASDVQVSASSGLTPSAVSLDIVSGNDQTGLAGQTLAAPIVIHVGDKLHTVPASGMVVNWVVVSGGGSAFVGATQADAKGD